MRENFPFSFFVIIRRLIAAVPSGGGGNFVTILHNNGFIYQLGSGFLFPFYDLHDCV